MKMKFFTIKKIFFLLSVLFLILQSCSSSDNAGSVNNSYQGVLLKRSLGNDGISDFIYENGNKLSKIVHGSQGYDKFTYSGNLITKIEYADVNGVVSVTTTFSYNSDNKPIESRDYSIESLESISQYTYNSDGTVTINGMSRGSSNGVEQWSNSVNKIYFDTAGNVIKIENENGTTLIFYDNKNWPLKNIEGIYALYQSKNNKIRETRTSTFGSSETTWTYTYNSLNYPISATKIENGNSSNPVSFSY